MRCIMQIGKLVQEGAITIKTGPFGTQLKAAEYQETGIPVLNVKNLGYGTVNSAKLDHVGADTVERLRIHLLQQGDIVFGRKGAVDRHAYIDNESDGWMQGSDCIRLRVETDDINPRFLSYYFLTNQHKAFMISMCSHGTTMASLNQKILEQIDFPCLERNYQDKIVEILSKIDEKGRVNQKINENLIYFSKRGLCFGNGFRLHRLVCTNYQILLTSIQRHTRQRKTGALSTILTLATLHRGRLMKFST